MMSGGCNSLFLWVWVWHGHRLLLLLLHRLRQQEQVWVHLVLQVFHPSLRLQELRVSFYRPFFKNSEEIFENVFFFRKLRKGKWKIFSLFLDFSFFFWEKKKIINKNHCFFFCKGFSLFFFVYRKNLNFIKEDPASLQHSN